MKSRKEKIDAKASEGHFYISISDLMTSLLFVFILILAYVIFVFVEQNESFDAKVEELEKSQAMRASLLEEIQVELGDNSLDIDINAQKGSIRIGSDILFASGSARLSHKGKEIVQRLAKVIEAKMQEPKFKSVINTIFIEGHTDDVPLFQGTRARPWTNKELSVQRAINTYMDMDAATLGHLARLRNKEGKSIFSYSGYASSRPVCQRLDLGNKEVLSLAKCRAKNRRIELYFTINSPDLEHLKQIADMSSHGV